ncbi:MAG TPA: DNA polymerase III subunit epsilon [Kiloniellales bacterium]
MREIVLDTETTGLDPDAGHRVVEVACLELAQHIPTGRNFRRYVNPGREMPEDARAVHGLDDAFLAQQPLFADVVDEFLEFIGEAPLIIHNAQFDLKFLNAELARISRPPLDAARAVDTVALARRRFPGAQASLDALCRRFGIDLSARALHGALLDCELLAEVYLELRGGRQPGLDLDAKRQSAHGSGGASPERAARPARLHEPSAEEIAAHEAMLARLKDPIWRA